MLQSMGLQRIGHNLVTEQQQCGMRGCSLKFPQGGKTFLIYIFQVTFLFSKDSTAFFSNVEVFGPESAPLWNFMLMNKFLPFSLFFSKIIKSITLFLIPFLSNY